MHRRILTVSLSALALSCSAPAEDKIDLAAPVTCSALKAPTTADELTTALSQAKAGECVAPAAGTYRGTFTIPAGVSLVAQKGADVQFAGGSATAPVLLLSGGAGTGVYSVKLTGATSGGIVLKGGPATLQDVSVDKASGTALEISCDGATCLDDASLIALNNVALTHSSAGLVVKGAKVKATGGQVSAQEGLSVSAGTGVVATGGAVLEMNGTEVSDNKGVGMLLDGTNGTSAKLSDVKVLRNEERGIWAQGLRGTEDNPVLRIEGANTRIEANKIVGLGARDSKGIIIVSGRVTGTVAKSISADDGSSAEIGDGIGLFANTGAVKLQDVEISGNTRSQVLVDQGSKGIIIVSGNVNPTGGKYGVVVQHTTEMVSASTAPDAMAPQLAVSAPEIAVK